MIVQCIIVGLSRNSDGTFRAQIQSIADVNVQFQITLAANQAIQAYIGRAVTMTLAYN